jgi:hypothetical protein
MHRAVIGTGGGRVTVCPEWFPAPHCTALNNPYHRSIQSGGQVAEGITSAKALAPYPLGKFGHRHGTGKHQGPLLRGDGGQQLPLLTHGKGGQKFRSADGFQVAGQPIHEPLPFIIVWSGQLGIGPGITVIGVATKVNLTTDHADTGPIAQHIVGILRFMATDDRDTAAVELGKGITHRTENPQLRFFVFGVPLGHGQAAGTDGTADHHPATGHGITDTVGRIALDDDISADIKVSHIVRGGIITDYCSAGLPHTTQSLSYRTGDVQSQRLVDGPESQADIMLPKGLQNQLIGGSGSPANLFFKYFGR